MVEVEQILMVDFTSTQAWAKEVAPPASCVRGQTKAATAKLLNTSPLLTFDGVDKMYCQLAKIHAIAVVQLAECARWRQSNPATSPIWAGPVGRDPS
jgi:hypothetical protein